MKNKSIYVAIILVFVLSCKTKHKVVKTASETTSISESKTDSSLVVKTDSTKIITETKTETKKKSIIELTFDLDKNRLSGDSSLFNGNDTNGNGILGNLINKALRNASSLKIKLEQSLEHNNDQKETTQKNLKEIDKKSSNSNIAALQNKKQTVIEKKKDSTPKFNTVLIIGIVLIFLFLIFKFIWPFIKSYFKFFLF